MVFIFFSASTFVLFWFFFLFQINFNHLHPVNIDIPFSSFVHNCAPQPDPILQQTTTLQPVKLQPQTDQIQLTAPDLSEPLLMCQPTIMFDTSLTAHTLTLPHQIVHSHAHVHHNQHTTNHGHYLWWLFKNSQITFHSVKYFSCS